MKRILGVFLCFIILFSGCARKDTIGDKTPISVDGFYFDTVITVSIYGMDKEDADPILAECMKLAEKYENLFSNTVESSDISKINAKAPDWVEIDSETAYLIKKGCEFGDISGGIFDISMGKVTSMWDFENGTLPDFDVLKNKAKLVDYKKIETDGNKVRLTDSDVSVDLGGIAKGYIADKMHEYLENNGVYHAIINLGGNVDVIGDHVDGTPFKVGIQDPFSDTGDYLFIIPADNNTIVTSGNYQRFFEKDGVYYHHILDKNTGMPVNNGVSSVTVISDNSTDCDALSTTCFILGPEKGLSLIESLPDTEAIYILSDGEILKTSGISDLQFK